ncbi:hypothetical protein SKAU_G00270880 [Synaphobranchus kaupii]|uniref:Pre-mRNA polyadenylation factor Fip1 domain-containing protein n=1 Tax=Synaphobranchus kaupii TaxID=118154 RepID=A0A9Q1F0J6_SYNKA|nr:hypothetical protein SKAU_G00270880 [Synaphobranchus kaupii]
MATELGSSDPTSVPNLATGPEEDEEHWLYGDENSEKQMEENLPGFKDSTQESNLSCTEAKDTCVQVAKSGEDEDDEDSDSDDEDDVKVTIGNIKTGAPSYMAPPMNLSLKPGRGYLAAAAKLPPKGVDLEALGMNGLATEPEVETDIFEDKPWRKPGADLSDYFNYGFNEETWKAYCEKQRRLQLGLEPNVPLTSENKITVQQGRAAILEKEMEASAVEPDFKMDFPPPPITLPATSRLKAGPPPNRKLGGTIDVIGGQTGAIRRVEGRRREMHEQNPIQVLGDHSAKTQPFVPPAGPPPLPIGAPPPHFMHPPPPVSRMPPPLHPPGIPPPALPGLFPPLMAPPPNLLMPPLDGRCPPSGYSNRAPPAFGYNTADPNYISYPPVSSSHPPWGSSLEKGGAVGSGGHWEYGGSRRDRERDREMERERDRERDRTPTTSEYNNEDDRYHYYGHEREFHHGHEHSRERSCERIREKEERHRERRHREKEESKHKSSKRRQHDGEEGESHRRHKHKKSKRNKEEKEEGAGHGEEPEGKE